MKTTKRQRDVATPGFLSRCHFVSLSRRQSGFTLLELIITLSVLSILVMGTIPLAQNAVKRQKELRLRETLREIRDAIDEFKRDSIGACPLGSVSNQNANQFGGSNVPADPRSRVVIDDCTIFDTENLDRYPPTLEILVDGVKVKARGMNIKVGGGLDKDKSSQVFTEDATDEKKKFYLRELPIDPMTGESNWILRSSYQDADSGNWDDINVFDVRSMSDEEAFNGEKYSDW
jgi:general secretion pathway protein G